MRAGGILNKETLKMEYENNLKTAEQIAVAYGSNKKSVLRLMKKYSIKPVHTQRKFLGIQSVELTDLQKQVIFGTVMGDGCLALHGREARLMIGQCLAQYEYVAWKRGILRSVTHQDIYIKKDKQGHSTASFSTLVHPGLTEIYNLFYTHKVKTVTKAVLENLTPVSVAVWYMDDGSCDRKTSRLWTCSFSVQENELIAEWFASKYGIVCDVRTSVMGRNHKEYCYISFDTENTEKLHSLVSSYLLPSMQYKLGDNNPQRLYAEYVSNRIMI